MKITSAEIAAHHACTYVYPADPRGRGTYELHTERPQSVEVTITTETELEAAELSNAFAKSLRVRWAGGKTVRFTVHLSADGVNGGKNEAGIKRYRSFSKRLAVLGIRPTFDPRATCVNAYRTLDEFESALSAYATK